MSTTVTASITSTAAATIQSSQPLSTTFTGTPRVNFTRVFSTSEVDKAFFQTYTVTTTPTSIDLTALTDAYGDSIAFTIVRQLIIRNKDTTNTLTAGGGTNGLVSVLPDLVGYTASSGSDGACINLTTTVTVDATHKLLRLVASAATISVDVMILGE